MEKGIGAMDAKQFDQLTRTLSASSRRGLLHMLATLPLFGWLPLMLGAGDSVARSRRKRGGDGHDKQQNSERGKPGAENHKHEGRRRKHRNKRNHDHKHKEKKTCKPQSPAQTCEGRCGTVKNNCKKSVNCGSCACEPPCPVCQICNPATVQCLPDPAQVGEVCGDGLVCQDDGSCACQGSSCGGCRACEDGACVPDPSVVCEPSDQCHEAGVCDPETGACTNPRKADGTSCESGDPCVSQATCQNGVCTGEQKDCSSEDDVCNDGVCRADGSCGKRPKQDGTGCNADNSDCTSGDSCQNGVCTPGAGVDCRNQDDLCNRGVCRQEDGVCIKEPRPNDTPCNADNTACTPLDTCQNGTCVAGPPTVCVALDECHLVGTCNPLTGFCSDPPSPDGTPCGINGECQSGECVETCLFTNEVCDPDNDTCCNFDGEICASFAACSESGEGRCCRDTGASCERDCDCCGGTCAGGACCQSNQQCNFTSECCEGFVCVENVCQQACGTNHSFCGEIPCCPGFRCFDGECWPNSCLALTETCSDSSQCCQEGGTTCSGNRCCQAFNQTCDQTRECCGVDVCGPQGKCCRGSFFDPDKPGVRGCSAGGGCCPGRRCNPFSDSCCLVEGQPVPPESHGGVLDCCHFASENGVCACRADGQACSAPTGNPFLSSCCDGLLCVNGECQPPCSPWTGAGCGPGFPCCRPQVCGEFNLCVDP